MSDTIIGICSECGGAVVRHENGKVECRDCHAVLREVTGPVLPMQPGRKLLVEVDGQ